MLKLILLIASISLADGIGGLLDDLEITESEAQEIVQDKVETPVQQTIIQNNYMTEAHYSLYIVIGLFGTSIIIMKMVMTAIMDGDKHTSKDVIMGAGLVIVVFSTLFLVIAATSTEAMMAAIGIIGSVSGYVLGNSRSDKDDKRLISEQAKTIKQERKYNQKQK